MVALPSATLSVNGLFDSWIDALPLIGLRVGIF